MAGNHLEGQIAEKYGNRVRLRASGLCWKNNNLLMVNHKIVKNSAFWAPPGGGIEFGQTAHESLIREFKEEAFITIEPGRLLFVCEYLEQPLHAVELFFEAVYKEGQLATGSDPESEPGNQIITEVKYLDFKTIMSMPPSERHGIFRFATTPEDLRKLNGFYRI